MNKEPPQRAGISLRSFDVRAATDTLAYKAGRVGCAGGRAWELFLDVRGCDLAGGFRSLL
jgi:hypothetical protein